MVIARNALTDHRGERRALARSGDLRGENRLVRLDRGEHDAFAARHQLLDRPEGAGRNGFLRPGDLAQRLRAELHAESQRRARDHNRASHHRLLGGLHVLEPQLGLAMEPRLRNEHCQHAEHDGEGDHDDGAGAHGSPLGNTQLFVSLPDLPGSVEFFLKQFPRLKLC
jgi:hypothetical protein